MYGVKRAEIPALSEDRQQGLMSLARGVRLAFQLSRIISACFIARLEMFLTCYLNNLTGKHNLSQHMYSWVLSTIWV